MKMSPFNYPSTIVWVDDSQIFINSIQEVIHEFNPFQIKTFLSPIHCLEHLKQYEAENTEDNFILSCKKYEESDLVDHIPTDINFAKICSLLNSDHIKNEISVIIIDQNMPEMSGIELCKRLAHLPCKKILLTGSITEDEVISAFNSKIIDCYIRKNSETFIDEIKFHIKLLSEKYFAEKSSSLLSHIEADGRLHFSDPEFIEFFAAWCNKNNIVKYCLIDKLGNMRVENNKGEASYFIVYTQETINEFIRLNTMPDEFNEFIDLIRSKQQLPFFGERKNGWEFPTSEWGQYLYPSNLLDSKNQYYWFNVEAK